MLNSKRWRTNVEFEKMADKAALLTEEKLTTLIEKIIVRELDEQQKNFFKIISGNF